jgi:hypothetical protein
VSPSITCGTSCCYWPCRPTEPRLTATRWSSRTSRTSRSPGPRVLTIPVCSTSSTPPAGPPVSRLALVLRWSACRTCSPGRSPPASPGPSSTPPR